MANESSGTIEYSAVAESTVPALKSPHGIEQIIATFGDIYEYIGKDGTLNPKWQADVLTRLALPFPMVLSWDHEQRVSRMTCHAKLADVFTGVLESLQKNGLQEKIKTFGGCFSFRQQRTGSKLSAHSWGIAVDFNPETNAQGTAGDMDEKVIEVFRAAGFEWGGDWSGRVRDPMHFQFCTEY